jgi:hypothetical protein
MFYPFLAMSYVLRELRLTNSWKQKSPGTNAGAFLPMSG